MSPHNVNNVPPSVDAHTHSQEKWHNRLKWIVIAIIIGSILTPLSAFIQSNAFEIWNNVYNIFNSKNANSTSILTQLAPTYMGTYTPATPDIGPGTFVLSINSYDQKQGTLTATIVYNGDAKTDAYTCSGTVTNTQHITLNCSKSGQNATQQKFTLDGTIDLHAKTQATETWSSGLNTNDTLQPGQ